jgi:hypothetical protein
VKRLTLIATKENRVGRCRVDNLEKLSEEVQRRVRMGIEERITSPLYTNPHPDHLIL